MGTEAQIILFLVLATTILILLWLIRTLVEQLRRLDTERGEKLLDTQKWVCRSYLMRIMEYYGDGPSYFDVRGKLEGVQSLPQEEQPTAYIDLLAKAFGDFKQEHYDIDGFVPPEVVIQLASKDEDNIRSNIIVEITELLRTGVLDKN